MCVSPFLSLADLSQLVRCSRRFNGVVRRERSRGLQLEGQATIAPFSSSSLNHHVLSIALQRHSKSRVFVTRQALHNLKACPQLTALSLELPNYMDSDKLMQGQEIEQFVNTLTSILPTRLHSFSASLGCDRAFCWALFAALSVMPQLTELSFRTAYATLVLPLAVLHKLPHLRKLGLSSIDWSAALLEEVKQLSQLRELRLHGLGLQGVITLCQPPHSLQLETIELLSGTYLNSTGMQALLQLSTLTALDPGFLGPEAWPLFPRLPLLQKLSVKYYDVLTVDHLSLLSASLSHCGSLRDLSLQLFLNPEVAEEQQRAGWADLLRSIPNVRRLAVSHSQLTPMRAVLPLHLPLLEELSLSGWDLPEVVLPQLAHPNIRQIQLRSYGGKFPEEQVRALIHSKQLPKLERISCIDPPEDV
jgi:hypothetical protein